MTVMLIVISLAVFSLDMINLLMYDEFVTVV